jgi:hypothetical protein
VSAPFHGGQKQMSQEEMINITSCDFTEFSKFMKGLYGAMAFEKGYKIVQDN